MVDLFGRIRALLGMNVDVEEEAESTETEPVVVSMPVEVQDAPLVDNKVYCAILRGEPGVQGQAETADLQAPEPKYVGELEQLKHYAELAKQNKLDSDALNEDLE
jgi:hypothetical protein